MTRILECVPNFSEGRQLQVIESIEVALSSIAGVHILDRHVDPDHNRSVFTLAGEPNHVAESILAATRLAVEKIDLSKHRGQHPRVGALDVVPFVPLKDISMAECADLARNVGKRIAQAFRIPVYLYEAAALRSGRERLERIRRLGFEHLLSQVTLDEELQPDFGPPRLHPRAGATFVGARKPLVAFNINLETSDVGVARAIASKIRESAGGLPGVKALGLLMETSGRAQVSMNLTDYEHTGLAKVFLAVDQLAHQAGVSIHNSELVGLAPEAAFEGVVAGELKIERFTASKVLEHCLKKVGFVL